MKLHFFILVLLISYLCVRPEFEEGEGAPEENEEVHGMGSEGSEGTDAIEDGDEEMENVDPQSDHSDENNINLNGKLTQTTLVT